jgi:hypothetical protein
MVSLDTLMRLLVLVGIMAVRRAFLSRADARPRQDRQ